MKSANLLISLVRYQHTIRTRGGISFHARESNDAYLRACRSLQDLRALAHDRRGSITLEPFSDVEHFDNFIAEHYCRSRTITCIYCMYAMKHPNNMCGLLVAACYCASWSLDLDQYRTPKLQ